MKPSLGCANQWGRLLGRLVYLIDAPNRRIARCNLKFAFPEWPPAQIEMTVKRVYQHFGISALELLSTAFMSHDDIIEHSRIMGEDNLVRALNKGNGAILMSAHIGNWELGLQFLRCHFDRPINLVARRLKLSLLNDLIHFLRTRYGNKIIYSKGTFDIMVKTLRQGGILALMADLPRKKYSVEVNFMGHRARSAYVVALLALRCKSPVIPSFTYRDKDGCITPELGAPVKITRTGKMGADLQINTQRFSDIVEEAVHRRPDQWLWMQKRWKDFYPLLYPSFMARRMRKLFRNLPPPSDLN